MVDSMASVVEDYRIEGLSFKLNPGALCYGMQARLPFYRGLQYLPVRLRGSCDTYQSHGGRMAGPLNGKTHVYSGEFRRNRQPSAPPHLLPKRLDVWSVVRSSMAWIATTACMRCFTS